MKADPAHKWVGKALSTRTRMSLSSLHLTCKLRHRSAQNIRRAMHRFLVHSMSEHSRVHIISRTLCTERIMCIQSWRGLPYSWLGSQWHSWANWRIRVQRIWCRGGVWFGLLEVKERVLSRLNCLWDRRRSRGFPCLCTPSEYTPHHLLWRSKVHRTIPIDWLFLQHLQHQRLWCHNRNLNYTTHRLVWRCCLTRNPLHPAPTCRCWPA